MSCYIGYEGFLEEKKENKTKKLYKSTRAGLYGAIIGTYLADLVRNIFVENKTEILDVIMNISPIDNYMGSAAGGTAGGLVRTYLDPITTSSVSVGTNKITTNYTSKSLNNNYLDDYELAEAIIFDNIAIGIILFIFGPDLLDNVEADHNIVFTEQLIIFFVINLYYLYRTPAIAVDLID